MLRHVLHEVTRVKVNSVLVIRLAYLEIHVRVHHFVGFVKLLIRRFSMCSGDLHQAPRPSRSTDSESIGVRKQLRAP